MHDNPNSKSTAVQSSLSKLMSCSISVASNMKITKLFRAKEIAVDGILHLHNILQQAPRGIAQRTKRSPAMQVAEVLTQAQPKILVSGTSPHALSLSLIMPVAMCSRVNTCQRGGKERGIVTKS